jgi:hypothetical protein
LNQYISKKEKLIAYLMDALVDPFLRSPNSFSMIQQLLTRFYPNLPILQQNEVDSMDFRELQAALSA